MENEFLEALYVNEEFTFSYNNVKYEIIHDGTCFVALFLDDGSKRGKLINKYNSYEDLLNNGIIQGRKIKDIIQDIEFIIQDIELW